jgi:hypothetical protein
MISRKKKNKKWLLPAAVRSTLIQEKAVLWLFE